LQHSQIRQSQLSALSEQVRRLNYSKYLRRVRLTKVRAFSGAAVSFDFPVTALVGPNGGGKSTVLGAAACAYKSIKPGLFFPKSSIGDNSMSQWSIEYELIDKEVNPNSWIRRSSIFKQMRWRRHDVVSRSVSYFGIARTVPAGERSEFKKLMHPSYVHNEPLQALPNQAATEIEHILGRPVHEFKHTKIAPGKTFHVGWNRGNEYSEFHFGAGESSIIRIVTEIERVPESSLILIEEIENGLHPIATRSLVEYLIVAAERRHIQAIFTTHSDEALAPLPQEAVWSCLNGQTQQGKLSIKTLRAISGKVDTALAVFTEDDFGKFIVQSMIREFITDCYDQVEVHAVSGNGNAVKIHQNRFQDPTAKYRSLCVIDGDSQQKEDQEHGIFRLPGAQPEANVFNEIMNALPINISLLTVSLHLPNEKQAFVTRVLNEVASTNRDPHLLFNQVGFQLGFIPEEIVKGAFVSLWVRGHAEQLKPMVMRIKDEILTYRNGTSKPE
jgi:hypothetical protein